MRIAKPLLLVTTPIGVLGAIREAYRLTGGLVVLMVALLAAISAAVGMLVLTVRKEQKQARDRLLEASETRPYEACSEHAEELWKS